MNTPINPLFIESFDVFIGIADFVISFSYGDGNETAVEIHPITATMDEKEE